MKTAKSEKIIEEAQIENVDGLAIVDSYLSPGEKAYIKRITLDAYGELRWAFKTPVKCRCGLVTCESCRLVFNSWTTELVESVFANVKDFGYLTFRYPIMRNDSDNRSLLQVKKTVVEALDVIGFYGQKWVGVIDAVVDVAVTRNDNHIGAIYGFLISSSISEVDIRNIRNSADEMPDWQLKLSFPFQNAWSTSLGDRRLETIAPSEYVAWPSMISDFNVIRSDVKDREYRSFFVRRVPQRSNFFVNVYDITRWLALTCH
jgi:hypothetical protein